MSPKKGPFKKETHSPTIIFQGIGLFSGEYTAVVLWCDHVLVLSELLHVDSFTGALNGTRLFSSAAHAGTGIFMTHRSRSIFPAIPMEFLKTSKNTSNYDIVN